MEVVVRVPGVVRVRLLDRDVVEAAPLEQDSPARERELLDDAADHLAASGAADRRQVRRPDHVARGEGGAARRQLELVQVEPSTGCRQPRDHSVGRVHDDEPAAAEPTFCSAFPPREHGFALVERRAEVHRRERRRRVEPDDVSPSVEDQRAALSRARGRREEEGVVGHLPHAGSSRAVAADPAASGSAGRRSATEASPPRLPAAPSRPSSATPPSSEPERAARGTPQEAGASRVLVADQRERVRIEGDHRPPRDQPIKSWIAARPSSACRPGRDARRQYCRDSVAGTTRSSENPRAKPGWPGTRPTRGHR